MTLKNSLPLMGIGNRVAVGWPAALYPLITPHGNRKQSSTLISRKGIDISLPLMGIGNARTCNARAETPTTELITPHGDRKRGPGSVVISEESGISLPLMGIGNDECLARGTNIEELITPHGDRKR